MFRDSLYTYIDIFIQYVNVYVGIISFSRYSNICKEKRAWGGAICREYMKT